MKLTKKVYSFCELNFWIYILWYIFFLYVFSKKFIAIINSFVKNTKICSTNEYNAVLPCPLVVTAESSFWCTILHFSSWIQLKLFIWIFANENVPGIKGYFKNILENLESSGSFGATFLWEPSIQTKTLSPNFF